MTGSPTQHRVEHLMGTVFSFHLRTPVPQAVLEAQVQWLHDMEAIFTTYSPDSIISRLGRGELEAADCPPVVADVLAQCEALKQETGGWFDIQASGTLDPSGLVKGWAVQRVSDAIRDAGSTRYSVNGGGDVCVRGGSAPDVPWRVGIAHPYEPGKLAGVVALTDGAVATSGTAERGAHVYDPHTHQPVSDIVSVSVVGPDLVRADVYATAAVAMGRRALTWVGTLTGYEAMVVTAERRVVYTDGWPAAS